MIRIPVAWLKEIVEDMEENPLEKTEWEFMSDGGNKLKATRVTGADDHGRRYDSIDFVYNPDD